VEITQLESIPDDLRRFEAKIDGPLWLEVIDALPKTLAEPLAASVKSSESSNSGIKQRIANGRVVEEVSVKTRIPPTDRIVKGHSLASG
jgi:hypothetical protein